jgi:hypothetical protein
LLQLKQEVQYQRGQAQREGVMPRALLEGEGHQEVVELKRVQWEQGES